MRESLHVRAKCGCILRDDDNAVNSAIACWKRALYLCEELAVEVPRIHEKAGVTLRRDGLARLYAKQRLPFFALRHVREGSGNESRRDAVSVTQYAVSVTSRGFIQRSR